MIAIAETIFKILADKNRIRILKLFEQRPLCVCELAFVLKVTQPSISRHIKKMKEAGIVKDKKDGLWTNYYLVKSSYFSKEILEYLNHLLGDDIQIKKDKECLNKIDRTKLCKIEN